MDNEEQIQTTYLGELYRQTGGDLEAQVSMHELGGAIGLEKSEAGIIAEQLIYQGLVELRTLSGGISLTPEGISALGFTPPASGDSGDDLRLSQGPEASADDRRLVQQLADEVKKEVSSLSVDYQLLEILVLDLKTIELQLLSPRPQLAVLRELLRALQMTLEETGQEKTSARLQAITS